MGSVLGFGARVGNDRLVVVAGESGRLVAGDGIAGLARPRVGPVLANGLCANTYEGASDIGEGSGWSLGLQVLVESVSDGDAAQAVP